MDNSVIKKLDVFFAQTLSHLYKKGDMLFEAGRQPHHIVYIESGIVRRYYLTTNGDEVTLNLYKPHTFLPMSWAIANIPNTHFYEALTPVKVKIAEKDSFLAFLKKDPTILYDLLQRVYTGLEGLWMHVESLTTGTSMLKLITSLVMLAHRFGRQEKNTVIITLKISEKELATIAGIARETVSREFHALQKNHLVTFSKGIITIHAMQKLEDMLLR